MSVTYSLEQLSKKLQAKLHGDPDCQISGVAALNQAQKGQASYVDSPKYAKKLSATKASVVILTSPLLEHCPTNALIVARPRLAFAELLHLLYPPKSASGSIHPTSYIGKNCNIDPSVEIGPHVVIGDGVSIGKQTCIGAGSFIGEGTQIGEHCQLYPKVTLYHQIKVGSRVILHSGAVIGADGFGFELNTQQEWVKILQLGSVVIGDEVEIGANTTIDRGSLQNTVIGRGVKLDNQIMVAHNVTIGDHTLIAGCTGIAGSTKVGRNCIIGGHCAINGHIELGDHVIITGAAMVTRSLLEPGIYSSGTGILPNKEWLKSAVRFKQLDNMYLRLQQLERERK